MFVETYNSAVTIDPSGQVGPVYGKIVLVPFAERLPHAELLAFLIEPLKWGVGISSWGQGQDTVVYGMRTSGGDSVRFSAMVCYESVYPEFVRSFVQKGAEFLVVITNDSWWDRTSGAYQHAAFASLRAVENRRWVVQCANGGISVVVHPSGRPLIATGLYEQAAFSHPIRRLHAQSFYTERGDLLGKLNAWFGFGLFAWGVVMRSISRKRNDRPSK